MDFDETRHKIRMATLESEHYRNCAVLLAQKANTCRLCHRMPPKIPTTLNYGKEHACSECLENRERI